MPLTGNIKVSPTKLNGTSMMINGYKRIVPKASPTSPAGTVLEKVRRETSS